MIVAFSRLMPRPLAWRGSSILFPFCLLAFGFYFLSDYLRGTAITLLAGYVAIAFSITKQHSVRPLKFLIAAFILLLLIWLIPVKTLLYFALAAAFFYWIEENYGRIHFLGIVALFLSSPAFQYAAGAFSFPIRLQLTKVVGAVFSLFASNLELRGNVILFEGREFVVDPACMGLHMLSLSLLLGILLLGLLQRKTGKLIKWQTAVLYLICLFVFNLVANILRIILLVQFAIPPEASMHDVIGLACLFIYVCVPACYLAKYFVSKAAIENESVRQAASKRHLLILQWILLAGLLLAALRVETVDTYSRFTDKYTQVINGYTSSVYAPGIVKLENTEALLYVKFIRGFYDTEHNPTMCWRGSGYVFNDVKIQTVEGKEVYIATLCKGNNKLYTAWWYGNANYATTSQWKWRWSMAKSSHHYAVINVTTATPTALNAEVKKILSTQILEPLFK